MSANPTEEELAQRVDDYVAAVAIKLGWKLNTVPDDVRAQIERCGQNGFNVNEAYYSMKEFLHP